VCACALWCRWYSQAGTPRLTVTTDYNPSDKTYKLRFQQVLLPDAAAASQQAALWLLAGHSPPSKTDSMCAGQYRAHGGPTRTHTFRIHTFRTHMSHKHFSYSLPRPFRPSQATDPSPGQPEKAAVLIPVRLGLLAKDGSEIPLKLQG
jgi:hypothetical protein